MTRRLLAGTLILAFSGCVVPNRFTLTPHLGGRVTDATTHKAIPNASVTVTSRHTAHRSCTVLTDSEGAFDVPQLKAWGVYLVPRYVIPPDADLLVEAKGYGSYSNKGIVKGLVEQSQAASSWCVPGGDDGNSIHAKLRQLQIPLQRK